MSNQVRIRMRVRELLLGPDQEDFLVVLAGFALPGIDLEGILSSFAAR